MKITVTLELPQDGELLTLLVEKVGYKSTTAPATAPTPASEPKKRKKAEPVTAREVVAADPLMQGEAPVGPTPAQAAAIGAVMSGTLSEAESATRAAELAKALCNAFPEKESNGRPKGFNMAMGALAKHKVARTSDLTHAQRLQFIAEVEAMMPREMAAA